MTVTSTAKKILEEALGLPEEDRRRVARLLLESLQGSSSEEIARAWDEEVRRRIELAERGETRARDGAEVSAELRAKYAAT